MGDGWVDTLFFTMPRLSVAMSGLKQSRCGASGGGGASHCLRFDSFEGPELKSALFASGFATERVTPLENEFNFIVGSPLF
jgi:hypothetical protein